MQEKKFSYRRLMFTTFVISGCSMVYELLISSVSSYLLGDSILQFSITIGLYMCAMGLGSYLSKFIKTQLFDWFISWKSAWEYWEEPALFCCFLPMSI